MRERRQREINKQRHKAMAADADRLLELARQIKEAAGANEEIPPGSVLPRLDAVEKLARSIKTKMQENVNLGE